MYNILQNIRMADHIRSDDCPPDKAPPYPGRKTKNNKDGVELTKNEFTDKVISDWVRHFEDKDRYQNTPWGVKTMYLMLHLKPLGVGMKVAKERLVEMERKLAEEGAENELISSQNNLNDVMEIDNQDTEEDTWSKMSRRAKDRGIDKILELNNEELFEGGLEIPENVKDSTRYKKREAAYFLAMSDVDLFDRYEKLSNYTKSSEEFKKRHALFVDKYMEDNFAQTSSQEILIKLSQTPTSVQNSEAYKTRLSHLTFEERSEKLVMKNIKETVHELNKTPEGKKQAKMFIAGVSHPVYGDPGLGLSKKTKSEIKKIKGTLLSEKEATLKVPDMKKRQIFPKSVEDIARNHWLENTIPEPAKQTGKVIEDGGETVPKRYQDKTDSECYENFKDDCAGKVRREMVRMADGIIHQVSGRKDSADKKRRVEYAQTLAEKFPSLTWYISQRPPETKPLCDHTTGLCHICEAAKKNFDSIVQAAKRKCSCSTRSCPNWFCACPVPEDDEEEMPCSCPPCECEDCSSCQVSISLTLSLKSGKVI